MGKELFFKQNTNISNRTQMEECIKTFSTEQDLSLNSSDFKHMLTDLLTDSEGRPNIVPESIQTDLFTFFDKNSDGKIDISEFDIVWNKFIKPIINPITALLIIDVQNDFIDGPLALKNCPAKQDGSDVIAEINKMLDQFKFDVVAYSLDWHPENHISFIENVKLYKLSSKNKPSDEISVYDTVLFEGHPEISQKLWPAHCIQNSWGSKLHKDLKIVQDALLIYKGTEPKSDSYSAYFDNLKLAQSNLHEELQKRNVTHVFLCGLVMEYCVSHTAVDALDLGYATTIIEDLVGIMDRKTANDTVNSLKSQGCVFVDSNKIEPLLKGTETKLEFATNFLKSLKMCVS